VSRAQWNDITQETKRKSEQYKPEKFTDMKHGKGQNKTVCYFATPETREKNLQVYHV